jgi:hypothetical protein
MDALEKTQPLQQMKLEKLVINVHKTETRSPSLHPVQKPIQNGPMILMENLKLQNYNKKKWKTLEDTVTGKYFLSRTPIAQEIRKKTDKWDRF